MCATVSGGRESIDAPRVSLSEDVATGESVLFNVATGKRVLFVGTEFSILYTSVYPPAGAAYPCAWCL